MKKNALTLRSAIVLAVVVGLLVPALLVSGYAWFRAYDSEVQKRTRELAEENAEILAYGMREPLWNINNESATALLDAMMGRNKDIVRIQVRDNSLDVIAANERSERRIGITATAEKPVIYRNATIGSVRIEVDSTRLQKILVDGLFQQMIALAAQVALSIVLVLILLEKRLISPLQRLSMGAKHLAGRRLDVPFTWKRLDEIGLLSLRLEETRISLHNLFEELDRKNRELEQDIDMRKRIEQELNEREARYRVLVEQSPIAIIEWDSNYQVVEWNAAAERIFGYKRDQAIGRDVGFIVPDSEHECMNTVFSRLASGTNDVPTINKNRTADGRIITCQWRNAHIDDESGRNGRLLSMAEDISEKRRTEEARRLSEAKFAGAFQCNPDSISIARLNDGVLIDVNQTFEKLTGFARNEWTGKSALDLHIWHAPAQRVVLLEQLARHKIVHDFAWSMRTKSGAIRKCLVNATVFNVGAELYVLAVIRDVTSQRLLEEQKAEADHALLRLAQGARGIAGESFFELLVTDLASALRTDRAFIGLRCTDEPSRIRTLAAHLNGRLVENVEYVAVGMPCECTLMGDICVYPGGIQTMFANDDALQGWDSYAGAPLRDAGGNVIGVLAVMHSRPLGNPDLVGSLLQVFSERASAELERKRAEEELRSSEQRFSTIFQSTPVAMFVVQLDGGHLIKDINSAFERLFLHTRDSVIGNSTSGLSLYCNAADRTMLIEELKNTGSSLGHHEFWMRRGDASKVLVQFSGHMFSVEGEEFGILACQDVTDKRRIENEILDLNATLEERVAERTEELRQANQELEITLDALNMAQQELIHSEKLAALGSLVAGIAHELNTPIGNSLMVASTFADQTGALTSDYASHKGIKRSALESYISDAGKASDILVRNLQRAADLVNSFKQVAIDQTSSQRRKFSLAEVTGEILLTLWPALRKNEFTVEQNIPDDMFLDSYPGPLGQVLTNLINNALLHGFEDRNLGTIVIAALPGADGWIELTVKDDGVGIPAAHLNRIFDPFFTTKLGAGGSGLGLNITHNIVTRVLGGRVRVQSAVGVGTIFTLTLPLVAPQRDSEDDTMHQTSPLP
jgi:PAS domain S-box-containing protein